jgi:hypothetical protein
MGNRDIICHETAYHEHLGLQITNEIAEKPTSERLTENVHMQGFRDPEE